jgi:hypothetical protein
LPFCLAPQAESIRAGQDVFLQFPGISRWAWHPFTIFKVCGSRTMA